MANKKISELTTGTVKNGLFFPVVDGDITKKVLFSAIKNNIFQNIFKGWITGLGAYLDGTNLKYYPYIINVNNTIYQSTSSVTVVDATTLNASEWYALVIREGTGALSVIRMTGNAVFDNLTITGNQLNMLSIYDEEHNCCRDSASGVWYRVLAVCKSNSTPNGFDYIIPIPNLPLDYVEAGMSGTQTITTGTYSIINFDTINIDLNSSVTTGANWKFEPSLNGIFEFDISIEFADTNNWTQGEVAFFSLYKNATRTRLLFFHEVETTFTGLGIRGSGSVKVALTKEDDIDSRCYQISGNDLDLTGDAEDNYIAIKGVET